MQLKWEWSLCWGGTALGRGPGSSVPSPGSYNYWSVLSKLYLKTAFCFCTAIKKVLQGNFCVLKA